MANGASRVSCLAAVVAMSILLAAPASAQSFSPTVTPNPVYVNEQGAATATVTVVPSSGFTGSVTLSLPAHRVESPHYLPPSVTTSTSTLIFTADINAAPGLAPLTITGTSGTITKNASLSLAVSAATRTGGTGVPVDLSAAYNVYGIYPDGTTFTTGGLDGGGNSYSANLLTAGRQAFGIQFNFGPSNAPDAVSGTGVPILLPVGQFGHLRIFATGVNGVQGSQVITVTYTDSTTTKLTQSFSDWYTPHRLTDQLEEVVMPYRMQPAASKIIGYSTCTVIAWC